MNAPEPKFEPEQKPVDLSFLRLSAALEMAVQQRDGAMNAILTNHANLKALQVEYDASLKLIAELRDEVIKLRAEVKDLNEVLLNSPASEKPD